MKCISDKQSNEEKFSGSIYRFTGDRNRKMSLT